MAKILGTSVRLDFTAMNFVDLQLDCDEFYIQTEVKADVLLEAIKEGKLKYVEVGDELVLVATKEWLQRFRVYPAAVDRPRSSLRLRRYDIKEKRSRTDKVGQIASVSNGRTVVISRGAREGVGLGSIYCILTNDRDGELAALLRVYEVTEKLALAEPFWASEQCPTLKRGWHVFLMEIAEA